MERFYSNPNTSTKEAEYSLSDLDYLLSQGLIEGIPPAELAAQYGVELGRVRAILVGGQHEAR